MRKTAIVLALTAAGMLAGAGAVNAQEPAPRTPTVRQTGLEPAAQPRGYTGFSIRFSMRMAPGREASEQPPVIAAVQPGSPAHTAGLAPGDVILEVDGRDTREAGALLVRPGVRYVYRIRRGTEEREVVLVAAALPGTRP